MYKAVQYSFLTLSDVRVAPVNATGAKRVGGIPA